MFAGAAIWVVVPLLLKLLVGSTSYPSQASSQLAFLSFWLFVGRFGLDWVASSELNQRTYSLVFGATVLALVIKAGSYSLGLSPQTAQVYDLFVFFAGGLVATLLVEWRLWLSAAAYLGAFVVATQRPELSLWAMSASNVVLAASSLYVWRHDGARPMVRW